LEEQPVPKEFVDYMNYCRELKFDEKPDYNQCRRTFKDLFNKMGYEFDYEYDWMLLDKRKRNGARSVGRTTKDSNNNLGFTQPNGPGRPNNGEEDF
jgi:hypothetical protein